MKTNSTGPALLLLLLMGAPLGASDWTRFRGPGGAGISDDANVAVTWSESENLKWKTPLPGAGSSSPIVVGDRVFVTCFSGEANSLKRYLVCVGRQDGAVAWSKSVDAEQPEDAYQGYLTQHGYASNTPVTDGERVYAFFGKTGVLAFDLDGKQLWQVNVGKESSNRRWGSAASLILYKDTVIVNASEESQSIRALDQATGREIWSVPAASLELTYGTPILVKLDNNRTDLVISVPSEVWGLNPDTGKLTWYAATKLTGNICPSIVAGDGVIYTFGGFRSSGSHAIRLGGKGDVTDSHMLWSSRNSSYVATPLLHQGHLYWVDDRGQAFCVEAKSGNLVYRERLRGVSSGGRPFYASPILAGGKLYVVSRRDGTFVFAAKPEFEQVAQNKFVSDETDFSATPAVSNGELILRSGAFLYSVADQQEE
jgi:outer membrane protein assembly factor BamB